MSGNLKMHYIRKIFTILSFCLYNGNHNKPYTIFPLHVQCMNKYIKLRKLVLTVAQFC